MDKIAKAFVAAQTAFGPALKTSANPFFKSKYADLSVVIEAVIDALHKNGIALIQNCHESDTGVIVETVFLHESGEMISCGKLSVPAAKHDPQGFGSAITYARRYGLMAACGIAPEDDDGNAAAKAKKDQDKQKPKSDAAKSVSQDVFDNMPPEEQQFLKDFAMNVYALLDEEKNYEAYKLIADSTLDADEKVAINALFNPKQRRAMKDAVEQQKEPA